jgi:hypothetical protein
VANGAGGAVPFPTAAEERRDALTFSRSQGFSMTFPPFARLALAAAAALLISGPAVAADGIDWPDAGEEAALQKVADLFHKAVGTELNKDGSIKTVKLSGRGEKDNASLKIQFDPKTQRVVTITGNVAGFLNEEFELFTPFVDLKALTLFHNACQCDRAMLPEVCDGAGLARLKGNAALRSFTLAGSPMDNDGLAAVAEVPQLTGLRMWHVKVDDDGFAALRNHPGLESIRLGPMWSPTITDATLEHLSHCPNLSNIFFGESYVTYENGLKHLTKLRGTLKTLDLDDTLVAPADLERFKEEMPDVTVKHKTTEEIGQMLAKDFKKSGTKVAEWVPQEVIDVYLDAAK